jgi:hypothetical protein
MGDGVCRPLPTYEPAPAGCTASMASWTLCYTETCMPCQLVRAFFRLLFSLTLPRNCRVRFALYASVVALADAAMTFLYNVATSAPLRPALEEAGVPAVAAAALEAHRDHAEITRRGRGVVDFFRPAFAAATAGLPTLVDVTPASLVGFLAAVTPPSALTNAELQLAALRNLTDLIPESFKDRCVAAEKCADWACAVIAAHPATGDIVERALLVLVRVVWATADERPLMRIVSQVVACLSRPPNSQCATHCASILCNLAFHSDNRVALMAHLPLVLTTMASLPNEGNLVQKGLHFMGNLAGNADLKPKLINNVSVAVSAVRKHPTHVTLNSSASYFLTVLSDSVALRPALKAAGIVAVAREIGAAHPAHADITRRTGTLLERLS